MRFASLLAAFLSFAAIAHGATIIVKVAENTTLTYNPPSVMAQAGDIIAFQFLAGNHTVTQSTFATPCSIMTTPAMGIDSSFQPVAAGASMIPQWSFTVTNASTPLWFYCRQTGHCKKGMVFAVNPTANKTYQGFLNNAVGNSTTSSGVSSMSGSGMSPSGTSSKGPVASSKSSGALALHGNNAAAVAILSGLLAGLFL